MLRLTIYQNVLAQTLDAGDIIIDPDGDLGFVVKPAGRTAMTYRYSRELRNATRRALNGLTDDLAAYLELDPKIRHGIEIENDYKRHHLVRTSVLVVPAFTSQAQADAWLEQHTP